MPQKNAKEIQDIVAKFGIYLNVKTGTVVRITSPYWFPEAPDWTLVTKEANSTLIAVRETVKEKGLFGNPSAVQWGQIPKKD